jgi:hypothetical protein
VDALPVSSTAPASRDCAVVELRQYTLRPGQANALIDLFDHELIETQEAVGMSVIGQFTDLDGPDRFAWLRGFADMHARQAGLQAFYGGPVWAAHRNAANATMLDSDNVLLLRPAWPGSAIDVAASQRPHLDARSAPGKGVVDATVFHLKPGAGAQAIDLAKGRMSQALADAGAKILGWYVTETADNTFPRLPIREGVNVLVGFAMFGDEHSHGRFAAAGPWTQKVPALVELLQSGVETLRLVPTGGSAIHA